MKRILFLLLFSIPISLSLSATTYFISPTGKDSYSVTISQPFYTLNKAWSMAVAGDIITVSYTKPANNPLEKFAGYVAENINNTAVTDNCKNTAVSNDLRVVVINVPKITYEGFISEIDASSTYDPNNDPLIFEFPASKNNTEYSYLKYFGHWNSLNIWNYISEFKIYGSGQCKFILSEVNDCSMSRIC